MSCSFIDASSCIESCLRCYSWFCEPCITAQTRRKQRKAILALQEWKCRIGASTVIGGGVGLIAIRDIDAGLLLFEYSSPELVEVKLPTDEKSALDLPSNELSPLTHAPQVLSAPRNGGARAESDATLPVCVQQAAEDLCYRNKRGTIWLPVESPRELSYAAALNHAPEDTSESTNDDGGGSSGANERTHSQHHAPKRVANVRLWWSGDIWQYWTIAPVACGDELFIDYRTLPETYDGDGEASFKYRCPDVYFAKMAGADAKKRQTPTAPDKR